MITLFHGEDVIASRQALTGLRQTYAQLSVIEFGEGGLTEMVRVADGADLFSDRKLLVVELPNPVSAKKLDYLSYLKNKPPSTHLVFWVGGTVPEDAELIRVAQREGWSIRFFDKFNRQTVFVFVDAVFSRNRRSALSGLKRLSDSGENLVGIISLIVFRVRTILWRKLGCACFGKLKPFLKSRVSQQADLFTEREVREIYRLCAGTDREVKNGSLDATLGIVSLVERIC